MAETGSVFAGMDEVFRLSAFVNGATMLEL
jgi:hypothetical protein